MSSGQRKHLQQSFWLEYPQGPQHASLPLCVCVCACVIGSFGGGVLTGRFNLLDDEDLRYSGDLMGRVKGFEERCCSTVLHQCNHDRCSPLKPAALTNALPVSFPRSLTPPHTSSLTLRYTHTQTRTLANFTAHWLVRPPSVVTL